MMSQLGTSLLTCEALSGVLGPALRILSTDKRSDQRSVCTTPQAASREAAELGPEPKALPSGVGLLPITACHFLLIDNWTGSKQAFPRKGFQVILPGRELEGKEVSIPDAPTTLLFPQQKCPRLVGTFKDTHPFALCSTWALPLDSYAYSCLPAFASSQALFSSCPSSKTHPRRPTLGDHP